MNSLTEFKQKMHLNHSEEDTTPKPSIKQEEGTLPNIKQEDIPTQIKTEVK